MIRLVDVVSVLDLLRVRSQRPDGEQMVGNVVMKAILVEEDVVIFVIHLKKF